ncbi:unnamed protein product [Rotaria socialis]|uniref:Uncharacterized protein n=1 Tax=Rotaria socialis TaxID=392032 RepID=A0A820U6L4_9BILA|nr:unnamed protein product [Rotaria socialis]CAF4482347.1 unnamed protein product [Rotaria socialis]
MATISTNEHICRVDGTTLQLRKFDEQVAHRAINTQETPDTIVTNFYKDLSDPSIARLPLRDNIKRRIRILHQKNQLVKEPNDPKFAPVPIAFTKTVLGRFTTEYDAKRPFTVVLRRFTVVRFDRPGLLSGCHFHLRQSIHRKLQALGHQNQYESDPLFTHNIHKIAALAFLKLTNVINGFEHLSIDLGDDNETILDYFEETYIDETGFADQTKGERVIVKSSRRHAFEANSGTGKDDRTALICVSAGGFVLSPLFLYSGKHLMDS